jgi:hypothetical protein
MIDNSEALFGTHRVPSSRHHYEIVPVANE